MSIDHTEPVQPGLYLATDRLLVAAHAGFAAPVSWLQADQYNLKFKAFCIIFWGRAIGEADRTNGKFLCDLLLHQNMYIDINIDCPILVTLVPIQPTPTLPRV